MTPEQIAAEPLYCATLDELNAARAANEELQGKNDELQKNLEEQQAENEELQKNLNEREKEVDLLKEQAANPGYNSDKSKPQATTSHVRVFDGDEWDVVVDRHPEQLKEAFVTDACSACGVTRDDLANVAFTVGSLHAAVDVTHNSDISSDAVDEMLGAYSFPNVMDLYARRHGPKRGLDALNEQMSELQGEKDELQKNLEEQQAENEELKKENEQLADEVGAFRAKRNEALDAREKDGDLPVDTPAVPADEAVSTAVTPEQIAAEPLYCATLDELNHQRDLVREKNEELECLQEKICEALGDVEDNEDADREEMLSKLEKLVGSLDAAREGERAALARVAEMESELERQRALFDAEEERLTNELEEAKADNERLQKEVDEMTNKLDEAIQMFGDADEAGAAGEAKLQSFAEVLASARDAQKDALSQLSAKEAELARATADLDAAKARIEELEQVEEELERVSNEKLISEAEAKTAMEDAESLRAAVKEAESLANEKGRELDEMTADMEALNDRVDNLVDELNEKTEQYNEIIHELDDFAKKQNREDEKELLQQLAARDQELFELQEARKGESGEHEKEVSLLQDQINRLREQLEDNNTLQQGLQDEVDRLRKALADAEENFQKKSDEVDDLRAGIEIMAEEHDEEMRAVDEEMEQKDKEASDALERLEEMTAMLQEARESEASTLRQRTDSDGEIFRLQKEIDRLRAAQVSPETEAREVAAQLAESENERIAAEKLLRDAEDRIAELEKKNKENAKQFENEAANNEEVIKELRKCLRKALASLSQSNTTMDESGQALAELKGRVEELTLE
ncbi:hypothetical protein, conserved [Angomonas deanei]|uniref:Flagellar attachment zone protein 1 conserved domain-containing protein n=1 Tax=Angomonas deanei TaxID=59799 RepID=A0A7G2C556_9TRYP|nr:hypothetical protein, conserved [Angomonas deanei]